MSKIAIIIPCYNEGERLSPGNFLSFIQTSPAADLIFVDDGSTDKTQSILWDLSGNQKERLRLITLPENKGKANAVRAGMMAAYQDRTYSHIGYLDADLSTSLEELLRLQQHLEKTNADYIMGSRMQLLQNRIERSWFRHLAGRLVATIVDSKFRLGIYDTQCGAKCFKRSLIATITREPFITRWFFDVEILLRIRYYSPKAVGIELPLQYWQNIPGSKMNIGSLPLVIKEIYRLMKNYRRP